MSHFLCVALAVACMADRAVNGMKVLLAFCLVYVTVNAAIAGVGRNSEGDEKQ